MKRYVVFVKHAVTGSVHDIGDVYAASCENAIRMLGGDPEWHDISHSAGILAGCAIAEELTAKGYDIVVMDATQFCSGTIQSAEDLKRRIERVL